MTISRVVKLLSPMLKVTLASVVALKSSGDIALPFDKEKLQKDYRILGVENFNCNCCDFWACY